MDVIIYNRIDGIGSILLSNFSQMIYAHKNKKKSIHEVFVSHLKSKTTRKRDKTLAYCTIWKKCMFHPAWTSLFIKAVINFTDYNKIIQLPKNNIDLFFDFNSKNFNSHININKIQIDTVINIKQDLFSYFHTHLKNDFFNYIKNNIYKTELPTKNKYICVHARLGNMSSNFCDDENIKEYTNYYINQINTCKNKSYKFKIREELKKLGITWQKRNDYQSCISFKKLVNNINYVKNKYPTYDIIIITDPRSTTNPKLVELGHTIIGTPKQEGVDYDMWIMLNSNVLVTSRSTISLVSAYLHQGEKIFFQPWCHFSSMGLKSKYDKSKNIIDYEFLN